MNRKGDSFGKRNVKSKQELKRKQKEEKRQIRKDSDKKSGFDDMIAYVDENGMISSTPPDPEKKIEISLEDIVISSPRKEDTAETNAERKGILVQFNESRGFGFIQEHESLQQYFTHVSEFTELLKEGDEVIFLITKNLRGLSAVSVRRA